MIRVRVVLVGLAIALAPALARAADDQEVLDRALLTQVRPLAVNTALVADGSPQARLVAPATEPWLDAAKRVQAEIDTVTGVRLPIVSDADLAADDWGDGNLVIIGNLLASPAFARLYHSFFVCADAGYTGTEGFELRTVHEPFGPGSNVVALGAEAAAGLARGTDRLLALVREHGRTGELVLPRLLELDLKRAGARAPVPRKLSDSNIAEGKAFHDRVYARPGTERSAAYSLARDGMRYHRTGDEGYLELFRYGMLSHIDYYRTNDYINTEGLKRYDRDFRDAWTWQFVVAWDLLEEHPGWSDDERLLITNHLLRCILECNVYQNWMGKDQIASWRRFDSIAHNHHTWPGLANLFGGWYFKRHYQHPMADDWLTVALGMFRGCRQSWKPWEDSAGYQWIPLRHVLTYSYASGDTTFIDQGQADLAERAVLMSIDSLGHQPAWGDHGAFTVASGIPETLSLLEYAVRDGRCRWALDRLGAASGGELEETYYADAKPKRPDELVGVTALYLTPAHYALNGRNPQYFPKANVSFEESFDKITLRAGWEPTDDYLMLDGYSGGSHGHQDCNAVIGYTAAGAHWLVDGEYIRQTPKHHCAVTVVRDGVSVRNPAMARLDDAAWYDDAAICRTTIPDYNGVRWTRCLFWRPNRFTVAVDELTALEPGDYSLRCCWRVYGEATLEGNRLGVRQGDARFTLQNLSADAIELVHIKNVGNLPVHHIYQRRARRLERGESVSFVNVFGAATGDVVPFTASLCGQRRAAVLIDGDTWIASAGPLDVGGVRIDAQAWLADAGGVRLASATGCTVGDRVVWHADEPRAVHVRGAALGVAAERETPQPGQRPVERVGPAVPERLPSPLEIDIQAINLPVEPQPLAPATALATADRLPIAWRFADFPRPPKALKCVSVRTDPQPHSGYRPVQRLIDGQYSSSTYSCLFPNGRRATIDLELEKTQTVTEVRIRAWEMSDSWKTTSRKLFLSTDGEAWTVAPGAMKVVGTERWGGNVNTIYAQPVDDQVRFVRVTAEPASETCSVYFAEIEVMGTDLAAPPRLTAIAGVDLDGDGAKEAVVGTAAGHVVALDATGSRRWQADVQAPITALAGIRPNGAEPQSVVYGASPDLLGLLAADGEKIHEVTIPHYRGIPSEPRNLTVADLDGVGVASIVAGVRSWQYVAYSPKLELQWQNVIYAHSATVAEVADLDGDGPMETVAGNAYFCLNVINADGTRRFSKGRFGPEQSAVTTVDLDGDGRREIAMGTDGGDVLLFDSRGNQLWERNVGDRVTSLTLVAVDGKTCIVAASESGYVWAFDAGGKPQWRTNLGEPVRRLIPSGDTLVCAASSAGVAVLSSSGAVTGVASTPAPAIDVVVLGTLCATQLADGSICGVALEQQ